MHRNGTGQAIVVGICLAIAGIAIGYGFYKGRAADRYVTVKGLAEKEVKADLAIWPITFQVTGNDLTRIQGGIEEGREIVTGFLTDAGFRREDIAYSPPRIRDLEAEYRGSDARTPYRYVAEATVTTRSRAVDLVKKTMEASGDLVGEGILLAPESWQNATEFLFTALNDIKPEMIEEATKNAREAAGKFAEDSGSRTGKIRHATQGYFSIQDRDRNSPDVKKVRVVTTVEYFLVD